MVSTLTSAASAITLRAGHRDTGASYNSGMVRLEVASFDPSDRLHQ